MYDEVLRFVGRLGIRSYLEIRLLLFLWQHPEFSGTYEQLCQRLYIGDCPLLEQIIHRFHQNGLIEECEGCYKLADHPEVKANLAGLAQAFDHPLTRQQLLAGVARRYG